MQKQHKAGENFWEALNPSTEMQLKAIEEKAYKEAELLYKEKPKLAKKYLKQLVNNIDLRKLLSDIYVWQRVDAVKRGIHKAEAKR